MLETSQAFISGRLVSDFKTITTNKGKKYYTANILVRRLSDIADYIPVKIPEWLINEGQNYEGQYASIEGQYQTCNYYDGLKRRLHQYVYARTIKIENYSKRRVDDNYIFLNGIVCVPPVYRITPSGRSITDLIIKVTPTHGYTYYIPCICWGQIAHFASNLLVGKHIEIRGRMQSREYDKKLSDLAVEKRFAYEVSVLKLDLSGF